MKKNRPTPLFLGYHNIKGWTVKTPSSPSFFRSLSHSSSLVLSIFPSFLCIPNSIPLFRSLAALPLEQIVTPVPKGVNNGIPYPPTFLVTLANSTNFPPPEPALDIFINDLLHRFFKHLSHHWQLIPNLLRTWHPKRNHLTVFPLVLITTSSEIDRSNISRLAFTAYQPWIQHLTAYIDRTARSFPDITPHLLFMLGLHSSPVIPRQFEIPLNIWHFLCPDSLTHHHWCSLMLLSRSWEEEFSTSTNLTKTSRLFKLLLSPCCYSECLKHCKEYPPKYFCSARTSYISRGALGLRSFPLHPLEANFSGMIPFMISLFRTMNLSLPQDTSSVLSTSLIPCIRTYYGSSWALIPRPIDNTPPPFGIL